MKFCSIWKTINTRQWNYETLFGYVKNKKRQPKFYFTNLYLSCWCNFSFLVSLRWKSTYILPLNLLRKATVHFILFHFISISFYVQFLFILQILVLKCFCSFSLWVLLKECRFKNLYPFYFTHRLWIIFFGDNQPAITCSKLTIQKLEQGVKYI